jgi:hypothetical protein
MGADDLHLRIHDRLWRALAVDELERETTMIDVDPFIETKFTAGLAQSMDGQ